MQNGRTRVTEQKMFRWGETIKFMQRLCIAENKWKILGLRFDENHRFVIFEGLFFKLLYHNVTDRRVDRRTVKTIHITALSKALARQKLKQCILYNIYLGYILFTLAIFVTTRRTTYSAIFSDIFTRRHIIIYNVKNARLPLNLHDSWRKDLHGGNSLTLIAATDCWDQILAVCEHGVSHSYFLEGCLFLVWPVISWNQFFFETI